MVTLSHLQLDVVVCRHLWTRDQSRKASRLWRRPITTDVALVAGDLIGGVDISTSLVEPDLAVAALVVLEYPSLAVVDDHVQCVCLTRPYIAGLLAYREGAACVRLVRN